MPWIPTPSDGLDSSDTLRTQYEIEQSISALLAEQLAGIKAADLEVDLHAAYSRRLLDNPLPPYFVGLDASRPWVLYWTLHSLALMGQPIEETLHERLAATLAAFQNREGGFGGGPSQLSHLAPTYAAVCALAYAGEKGWSIIDRSAMYQFLLSLKQPDGSFIMHHGGEVDVRGSYCALAIATLLNILTPELVETTAAFVASCQTYEGGLAAAAFATDPSLPTSRAAPLGEAHGGYAFCAAASWAMAEGPSQSASPATSPPLPALSDNRGRLDVPALLRWSASMQANPIEGGGFRGRTNKLVDGCYSWWCGGLLPIAEYLLGGAEGSDPLDGDELYDRVALQQYVTLIAQGPGGGLRDKPGKSPDAYHTCYNLSGASSATSRPVFSHPLYEQITQSFEPGKATETTSERTRTAATDATVATDQHRCRVYGRSLAWEIARPRAREDTTESADLVFTHPLFNICMPAVRAIMGHFYGQAAPA
ncbi:hypothetical protein JCM10908_006361 [Rhodotorula pacifica]|uniref:protein farnesyltransferase n=1 Tax=Rhodotorula pacifica TaxID=1495444 RepID=UPI00316DF357